MVTSSSVGAAERDRLRQVTVLATPGLWPHWPFLPVVRRSARGQECGLLCDLLGMDGRAGHSATVYRGNLFRLPRTLDLFVALPKEVFDTPEEVFAAGWRVD